MWRLKMEVQIPEQQLFEWIITGLEQVKEIRKVVSANYIIVRFSPLILPELEDQKTVLVMT